MLPNRAPTRGAAPLVAVSLLLAGFAGLLFPGASAATTVFADDFESGAPGWTATGLWNLNGDRPVSGTTAWYYGVSTAPGTADNTYATGNASNNGTLTSPLVSLPTGGSVFLAFATWWQGEGGCQREFPLVQLLVNSTTTTTVYANCNAASNGTITPVVNLTGFAGKDVRLRFVWDTKTAQNNSFEGWYVDDVRISFESTPPNVAVTALHMAGSGALPASGEQVTFIGTIRNPGTVAVTPLAYEFLVDGTPIATGLVGMGAFTSILVTTNWTASAGLHNVTLRIDPANAHAESNEMDNERSIFVHVLPGRPDLTMDVTGIRKVPVRTDQGDLHPHPMQRHVVSWTVCNVGTYDAFRPFLTLTAHASGFAGFASSDGFHASWILNIAPGACHSGETTWDAYHAVGDVRLDASIFVGNERETRNNHDTASTFVLVGNLGGFVLPSL